MVMLRSAAGTVVDVNDAMAARLRSRGWSGGDATPSPDQLAKSAKKAEWVDYAVSQGADRAEAEAATKDELVDTYG